MIATAKKAQVSPLVMSMILLGVFVIVAVSVVETSVTQAVNDATSVYTVSGELHTGVSNNTAFTLNTKGVQSGTEVLSNATGATLTRNTQYTINYGDVNTKATVTLTNVNTTTFGNNVSAAYSYVTPTYNSNAATRTVLSNIPLLLGVAVLFVVVSFMALKL